MLRGFTLIELVLVIAILGILAIAALPALFNVSLTTAKNNSMTAVASAVQSSITLYGANQVAQGASSVSYPSALDSAAAGAASGTAPLFGNVLQTPVTTEWIKKSPTCYIYDFNSTGSYAAGDTYFQYAPATGTFLVVSSC
jgi:prepilin-type N-terminal cleavage/methylation domain-containing protein